MKPCPFCAEEVQDTAIKCRHCGESLVVPEAPRKSRAPMVLALLTSALFSAPFFWLAKLSYDKADQVNGIIQAGFGIAFIVAGVIAWFLGDAFRRFAMPDMMFARGAVEMAGQRLFWLFGPQVVAVFLAFCGVFYLAGEVAPMKKDFPANAEATLAAPAAVSASDSAREDTSSVANSESDIEPSGSAGGEEEADKTVESTVNTTDPTAPGQAPTATGVDAVASRPAPSFNCAKASNEIEIMICASNVVADADLKLSVIYKEKLGNTSDRQSLKEEQRRWMREERDSCRTEACLIDAYRVRTDGLSNQH